MGRGQVRMRIAAESCALALCTTALAACGENATGPAPCPAADTLAPLRGITLRASCLSSLSFHGAGGVYVVIPQLAALETDTTSTSYELALGAPPAARWIAAEPEAAAGAAADPRTRLEHALQSRAAAELATGRAPAARSSGTRARLVPPLGSVRTFHVCGDAICTATLFHTDTASLVYVGDHVLLYLSGRAPPGGFSDAELARFGDLFDHTLYDIDVAAFAEPTDVDANGHVIVLVSPFVNAITTPQACVNGFLAGYFNGVDLVPTLPFSNDGEIYYALAPDPNGAFSCAHSVRDVERVTGATFLHELEHMINFGQKYLVHGLHHTETGFLDEGLANLAEELGARYYEAKYPPPAGRSDPAQLFPDSAVDFMAGDLRDSYFFLSRSTSASALVARGDGTLADAGGEWLFMRWLGDQKDSTIYRRLVQSGLTGPRNLEAQAGEPLAQLFGEFALALWADSLPGVPRTEVPSPNRFTSRNLRRMYGEFFRIVNGPIPAVPRRFPLVLQTLAPDAAAAGSMRAGSIAFYRLALPDTGTDAALRFTAPGGAALPQALGAQVSVFRCPAASACP